MVNVISDNRHYRVSNTGNVDLAVVWVAVRSAANRWRRVRNRRRVKRVLAQARRQAFA